MPIYSELLNADTVKITLRGDFNSMKKITCKVEQEDCLALERTDYEIRILKELIAFFKEIFMISDENSKQMIGLTSFKEEKKIELSIQKIILQNINMI